MHLYTHTHTHKYIQYIYNKLLLLLITEHIINLYYNIKVSLVLLYCNKVNEVWIALLLQATKVRLVPLPAAQVPTESREEAHTAGWTGRPSPLNTANTHTSTHIQSSTDETHLHISVSHRHRRPDDLPAPAPGLNLHHHHPHQCRPDDPHHPRPQAESSNCPD